MTALLAPIPRGDGPKRQHIRLRLGLSNIARRVAMRALAEHRQDLLLELYCAGIAHAVELLKDHSSSDAVRGEGDSSREPSPSTCASDGEPCPSDPQTRS